MSTTTTLGEMFREVARQFDVMVERTLRERGAEETAEALCGLLGAAIQQMEQAMMNEDHLKLALHAAEVVLANRGLNKISPLFAPLGEGPLQ